MDDTNLIRKQLINEIKKGNFRETGYKCDSGTEYVELRNVMFQVNKPYIFKNIPEYKRMSPEWYAKNYDPILWRNQQIQKCITKLVENPYSRQAVIFMGSETEYDNRDNQRNIPLMICTMYMHIFLDQVKDNQYTMSYIVHMRSNDSLEFRSDIRWHIRLRQMIKERIVDITKYEIIYEPIVWIADSFQLYKQYFDIVLENKVVEYGQI